MVDFAFWQNSSNPLLPRSGANTCHVSISLPYGAKEKGKAAKPAFQLSINDSQAFVFLPTIYRCVIK